METLPMFLLRRQNGVLYFRRPIPDTLRPFLNLGNKREITYSLKSKKLTAEARLRHHEFLMESERVLEEARLRAEASNSKRVSGNRREETPIDAVKPRSMWEFSDGELQSHLHRWLIKKKTTVLEESRLMFSFGEHCEREATLLENSNRLAALRRLPDSRPSLEVMANVRKMIEEAGGRIDHTTHAEHHLKWASVEAQMREGLIELADFEREILKTGVAPKIAPASDIPIPHTQPLLPLPASISLNELIEKYANDPNRQGITAKTRDEFQIVFKTLREMLGGKTPVASITRQQLKEIQSICLALPPHYAKRYPGKTMREVAALAQNEGKAGMSPATFNKRMTLLAGVFAYAEREHMITKSPARGLTVEKENKTPGEKSFTLAQLNAIFSSPIFQSYAEEPKARFTPEHKLLPHTFWVPLIGLFQGMRQEEILQLSPENVEQEEGVDCFKIGYSEGQHVKTKQSRRIVPIHPELIALGFLDFVAAVRKAGHTDIFSDAMRGKTYGNRSHNYSKRFNRDIAKIGVKSGRDQCFHSFRHTFADGMRKAGVQKEEIDRLGGWSTSWGNVSHSYGGRITQHLSTQLAKLAYPGLNLDHLRIKQVTTRPRKALSRGGG